ncbi:hypothetical protein TVAG_286740 [Trichomonas vaginalis G3]|uniref:F5/8 type C domain-containing protein n=1 Tax=Trichomonas vaginalis (strain ATCC PRA-98 / G3) TaxID=412133 RepID=A2F3F7_TRIV3|nr:hypothetical protein TVAGG3_0245250 [Trichomonas vaginalis G3]EAY00537.1 hypothetical protein TVAG_286740 [Trichomonas vaginalis G3]KAI5553609.1 hypothetical protein TVAGG3_0245250 [Trichomonas vaginalis G3]|eukprot:XP_001313466.1 hypothetical protein [Trichomonas vaginalis G3]
MFTYIREQNNGQNPLTCKAIDVYISNGYSGRTSNLFEYSKTGHGWGLSEVTNNFISFDFKENKISLEAYTIKSGYASGGSYWNHPVDFAIEGSNDNIEWSMIDDKPNNMDIGADDKVYTWKCNKSPLYRYIRFRLRSISYGGYLFTDHFEFFGSINTMNNDNIKYHISCNFMYYIIFHIPLIDLFFLS